MTTEERNDLIMEKLNEGMSLSDLQTLLAKEYGQKMTYFELRMLAADLQVNWTKLDRPKKKPAPIPQPQEQERPVFADEPEDEPAEEMAEPSTEEPAAPEAAEAAEADEALADGKAVVTLHDVPLKGTAMSGDVTFPSGIKSKWFMDRMGQLGLEQADDENAPQPSDEDLQAFQMELQQVMKKRSEDMMKKAFDGRTKVDISPIVKPGCQMNGNVTFASGAKGEWMLSQTEGLVFDLEEGSAQPTAEDKTFFQLVLRKALAEKGMA